MKITEMRDGPLRERILNAAQAVLAESADMAHMLQKADQFLAHEFEDPHTERDINSSMAQAIANGNGCIRIVLFVEPGGIVSGHKVSHDFPRIELTDRVIPDYTKVSSLEKIAFQDALESMKGKTYPKKAIVRWFMDYTVDMIS